MLSLRTDDSLILLVRHPDANPAQPDLGKTHTNQIQHAATDGNQPWPRTRNANSSAVTKESAQTLIKVKGKANPPNRSRGQTEKYTREPRAKGSKILIIAPWSFLLQKCH